MRNVIMLFLSIFFVTNVYSQKVAKFLDLRFDTICIDSFKTYKFNDGFIIDIDDENEIPINNIWFDDAENTKNVVIYDLNESINDSVLLGRIKSFFGNNPPQNDVDNELFVLQKGHRYRIRHERTFKLYLLNYEKKATDIQLSGGAMKIKEQEALYDEKSDVFRLTIDKQLSIDNCDTGYTLYRNGKEINDKLFVEVYSNKFSLCKKFVDGVVYFDYGDTLKIIDYSRNEYIVTFIKPEEPKTLNGWIIGILLFLLLITFGFLYVRRNSVHELFNKAMNILYVNHNSTKGINDGIKDFNKEVQKSISLLHKKLPKIVNNKHKEDYFHDINNIDAIVQDLNIIVSHCRKKNIVNEARQIIEYIEQNNQRNVETERTINQNSVDTTELVNQEPSGDIVVAEKQLVDVSVYNQLKQEYDNFKMEYDKNVEIVRQETRTAVEEELKKKINDAINAKIQAEKTKKDDIKKAVQEAEEEKDEVITKKQEMINRQKNQLTETAGKLETAENNLINANKLIDEQSAKIRQLIINQELFAKHLCSVPSAHNYCVRITEFMDLCKKIESDACSLLETNVEDPYFIMKALARYQDSKKEIRFDRFYTDVNLAANASLSFNDSSLATFDSGGKDIEAQVRAYFFNNYLQRYVNAVMVLNESMIGLQILIPEIDSKVKKFEEYRDEILKIADKLQITVICVKVGDFAGTNVDLKATVVDFDFGQSGQILEIENAIVYLSKGRKPSDKIRVTIKK